MLIEILHELMRLLQLDKLSPVLWKKMFELKETTVDKDKKNAKPCKNLVLGFGTRVCNYKLGIAKARGMPPGSKLANPHVKLIKLAALRNLKAKRNKNLAALEAKKTERLAAIKARRIEQLAALKNLEARRAQN